MITIDGSAGEGGGQILRSSLTLSLATGRPFRIEKIRAGREKPGLLRQHLTAIEAAALVSGARVEGAQLGSGCIEFQPGTVRGGAHRVAIGSAGSACLVLQTLIPALVLADAPTEIVVEGGTHNPLAPTFDFLERAFAPILRRMGVEITLELQRPGFFPAGGGIVRARIAATGRFEPIELLERGPILSRRVVALLAHLPRNIAEREIAVIERRMGVPPDSVEIVECETSLGPGNVVSIEMQCAELTAMFIGFGERDVRAEAVAERAVRHARDWIAADVPVDRYLADQLLVPMALAGRGRFKTQALSRHTTTNIDVVRRFLDVGIDVTDATRGAVVVDVH